MTLYTIGHSNHTIEQFVEILRHAGIERIIDVRSQPYSQFAPQYNRETLSRSLLDAGVDYVFAGKELGGRPEGNAYYDEAGRVLYGEYCKSDVFLKGIDDLRETVKGQKCAILCSEENPAVCHRKLLISRYLVGMGDEVYHIRGDLSVQSNAELDKGTTGSQQLQESLFDLGETLEWKSIRSVSPGKVQKSFSGN